MPATRNFLQESRAREDGFGRNRRTTKAEERVEEEARPAAAKGFCSSRCAVSDVAHRPTLQNLPKVTYNQPILLN